MGLFIGLNIKKLKETNKKKNINCINLDEKYFCLASNGKFYNDKFITRIDGTIILVDGVILNKEKIINEYNKNDFKDCIISEYNNGKLDEFINKLRGNFVIVLYDLKKDKLVAYTDHWSNIPLLYYKNNDVFLISTRLNELVENLKLNNIDYKLNMDGAYSLISYAYMLEDNTLVEDVKRLEAGSRLVYSNNNIEISSYHDWVFEEKKINKDEAIKKLDSLFLNAVEMQVNKNEEYGYRNIVPLSAGLDCRIVAYSLRRLGVENVLTYTYSDSKSNDYKYCPKMASDLKYEWLYKNLDNGLDLFNLDSSIKIADGLIYYPWASQFNTFLNAINTSEIGIIHTGVIGDVIPGSFNKSLDYKNKKYALGDGAYSTKLLNRISSNIKDTSYEEGMFRNRAINGACLGYSTSIKEYGEGMSPFMDVDFAEFCFSLPFEFRFKHNIYYSWVISNFKDATKYPHNGVKISSMRGIKINGKEYKLDTIKGLLMNKMKSKYSKRNDMNPFDYWYDNNQKLKRFMDDYFESNKECLKNYEQLYKDINFLYNSGNTIEKTLVLSLIGSYKYLF